MGRRGEGERGKVKGESEGGRGSGKEVGAQTEETRIKRLVAVSQE